MRLLLLLSLIYTIDFAYEIETCAETRIRSGNGKRQLNFGNYVNTHTDGEREQNAQQNTLAAAQNILYDPGYNRQDSQSVPAPTSYATVHHLVQGSYYPHAGSSAANATNYDQRFYDPIEQFAEKQQIQYLPVSQNLQAELPPVAAHTHATTFAQLPAVAANSVRKFDGNANTNEMDHPYAPYYQRDIYFRPSAQQQQQQQQQPLQQRQFQQQQLQIAQYQEQQSYQQPPYQQLQYQQQSYQQQEQQYQQREPPQQQEPYPQQQQYQQHQQQQQQHQQAVVLSTFQPRPASQATATSDSLSSTGPHVFPPSAAAQSMQSRNGRQLYSVSSTHFVPLTSLFQPNVSPAPAPTSALSYYQQQPQQQQRFQAPFRPSQFLGYIADERRPASSASIEASQADNDNRSRYTEAYPLSYYSSQSHQQLIKPIYERQSDSLAEGADRQSRRGRYVYMSPSNIYAFFKVK